MIPPIAGTSLDDRKPVKLPPLPTSQVALLILIFSESCHFCKANWNNWDKLFDSSSSPAKIVMVTADKKLSTTYQASSTVTAQPGHSWC